MLTYLLITLNCYRHVPGHASQREAGNSYHSTQVLNIYEHVAALRSVLLNDDDCGGDDDDDMANAVIDTVTL